MNPDEPLNNLVKKFEGPHLPQQDINSFLNEALKKTQVAARLADLSGDIGKRLASMASAADLSRQLLRSFEPPKSPFQRIIDEAARTAAVYRNLGSFTDTIAKAAASMRTTGDFHQELLRSVQLPKSSIQLAIDAAQKAALQFNFDSLERIREQTDAVSRMAKMYSSPAFGGMSQAIQEAMAASQLWQSSRITDFASRILRETEFRDAFLKRLESEPFTEAQPEAGMASTQEVLDAVECGLEESGNVQPTENVEAAVGRMFSWWAKLPPDLRSFTIALVVVILGLVIEYGLFVKDQPTSQLAAKQRVKIVQKITNNIFVNVGVSAEERSQFRLVTKDGLPVFRSKRRDAGKVARLSAAQVVTVKLQKRNWTQVEWKDTESQEMLTGWVFTRYLKKM
ncbi:MAG: hypothetical protein ABI651_13820 [Verrucomicrobiota bacterium]